MKTKRINFHDHIFIIILTPLVVFAGLISFFKFIINHDYMVGYEGNCDPVKEVCFKGCEDDMCTTEYYYSKIQKYAPDLYEQCGNDITDCELASKCLPSDTKCSITYCDEEIDVDSCETIKEESMLLNNNENL
jgi:hypothetical protein